MKKKNFFSSMRFKTLLMVIVSMFTIGAVLLLFVLLYVRSDNLDLHKDYMHDVNEAYGKMFEDSIKEAGADLVLDGEHLKRALEEISIAEMDSSYAYMVGPDGTMLYHPTAEKIGQPVENAVVTEVVNNIKAGKQKRECKVVTYKYKGADKYASYYVDEGINFILVVTADKEDCLADTHRTTSFALCIAFSLLAVFSIGTYFIVSRMIKPIDKISDVVGKISKMDFCPQQEQDELNIRMDESGQMSRAVTSLREHMKNVLTEIRGNSDELFEASESLTEKTKDVKKTMTQVENAVLDIANGATAQAGETQSATENVVLIGDMIKETNSEVDKIHDNAVSMRDESLEAAKMLKQLNEINITAKQSIDEIYEQTNTTNQSAVKIKEATNLITAIAEETNLLSLNASIEAARAGEQGRGFAVVASQIQKLAEQSNASAGQIEQIIASLIQDSERAVETMEDVKKVMEEQTANVEKTSEIFGKVQKRITDSVEGIDAITKQTRKMDGARVKVIEVVQNLSAIAEENAASTQETSASVTQVEDVMEDISSNAEKLRNIADNLENNMKVFKL